MGNETVNKRHVILTGRRKADAYLALTELPGRLISISSGNDRSSIIRTQVLNLEQAIQLKEVLTELIAHAKTQPEEIEPKMHWSGAERRDIHDD